MSVRRVIVPEIYRSVERVTRGGRAPFEPPDYYRGGAAGLPTGPLVRFADGTFTRASVGTYLTLTGANPLTQAAANEPRYENRNDGLGALLLIEGSRTNIVGYSYTMNSWSGAGNASTVTDNAATDPLGTNTASLLDLQGTGSNSRYHTWGSAIAGEVYSMSVWARGSAAGQVGKSFRLLCTNTASSVVARIDATLPTNWARFSDIRTAVSTTRVVYYDNRLNTPTGGDPALPQWTGHMWGHQLELGRFASSFIPTTTGSSVTRPADSMTYAAGSTPATLRSGRWKFPVFSPAFSSGQIISPNTFILASWGTGSDVIQLRHNGANVILEVIQGSVVKIASGAITFNAHQGLTLSFLADTGALEIAGANSGNGIVTGGTPWTMPDDTFRIGGVPGAASSEAFGRFAEPVRV